MTTPTPIEAGARALDPDAYEPINEARWESLARLESQAEAQLNAERKAQACIEAAIATGDLVPASAVADMRERCARVAELAGCGNQKCMDCYGNQIAAMIRDLSPIANGFVGDFPCFESDYKLILNAPYSNDGEG